MTDLNSIVGYCGILLTFLCCVAGVVTLGKRLLAPGSSIAPRASLGAIGRTYTTGSLLGSLIAVFAIERALVTHDFALVYVAQNNSKQTPLLYTVTGMWSSLAGSILLWGTILTVYITVVAWLYRKRGDNSTIAWVLLVGLVTAAFFFAMMLGPSNPFITSHVVPQNGQGPNPLLQDFPLVAFHPPLLYAGLVGFTVPFGFAIAGLVTGELGIGWANEVRRWTLFAWGCLGAGILLGAWWSYQVLGWGGFWGWDPVENAALVPWLVGTAFLHSVIVQSRRGILRVWNVSLIAAVFSLTILCTFLTRSGVLESVHAFSNSDIGPYLISFFGASLVVSVALIVWRGDLLRSESGIDSPISREGAFLANNLAFGVFAFVVLLGTVFPLLEEAITGQQVTVGSPYFNKMTMPVVVVILFLMAVAPVLGWRKATSETAARRLMAPGVFAAVVAVVCVASGIRGIGPLVVYVLAAFAAGSAIRQLALEVRRRGLIGVTGRSGGGMIVHLGVVVVAVGMASSLSYGHRTEVNLVPGQSARFDGHTVRYLGIRDVVYPNRSAVQAKVLVDGRRLVSPALSEYQGGGPAVGTPAVDSGVRDDVYVTLDMTPSTANGAAEIGVVVQPMVIWLWIGGAVIAFGTALSMIPGALVRTRKRRVLATRPDDVEGAELEQVGV